MCYHNVCHHLFILPCLNERLNYQAVVLSQQHPPISVVEVVASVVVVQSAKTTGKVHVGSRHHKGKGHNPGIQNSFYERATCKHYLHRNQMMTKSVTGPK